MKSKYPFLLYIKGLTAFIVLNLFIFNFNCLGQVSMTKSGSISQTFNSLSPSGGTWIDNSTISNWYWQEDLGLSQYLYDNGSSNPLITTRYAYGYITGPASDLAMGGIATAGTGFTMGIQLKNNSIAPIEEIQVSYTGEQWHFGGTSLRSKITFWYKISTSPIYDLTPGNNTGWTAATFLDFTSPIAYEGNPGQLDGNLSANKVVFSKVLMPNISIPAGSYIMFRWSYPDQNTYHGLAIDDVTITWVGNTANSGGIWNLKNNWDYGIPDATTNAIVNGNVTADFSSSCYNLIINSGKSLTINSGITLTAKKNFLIKSSSTGVGSFINNGTLSITGSPSVEMYVRGTTLHNGIYFSPPLSIINAPSVSDLVYRYNAATNEWILVYGTLVTGTGYTIRSYDPITIKLNGGSLYNSNLFIGGLVRQSNPNNFGWNLVGNPYVCGLDWEILNNTASNYTHLTNGFYIRASDGATISYVNGVGNPTGTTSIIPPFQGFYAQVLSGQTTGSLNIPLTARTHNTNNFYKNIIPIIRMQISSSDGYTDETVLRIENDATDKLDNEFDGTKMFAENDNYPQIFSLTSDQDELCINAISLAEEKIITVPLGFKSNFQGEYTIKAFDFGNIDKSISFFLKDNQTNIIQDLRKNPVYIFNTSPTFDTERFVMILSKQTTGICNDYNNSKPLITSINKCILIDMQGETNARIEIYNILGEQILNKLLNSSSLQKIDLSVTEGIYIVKVFNSNYSITKKVIIK